MVTEHRDTASASLGKTSETHGTHAEWAWRDAHDVARRVPCPRPVHQHSKATRVDAVDRIATDVGEQVGIAGRKPNRISCGPPSRVRIIVARSETKQVAIEVE